MIKLKKNQCHEKKTKGKIFELIRINSTNEIEIKKNRLIKEGTSKKNQS